MVVLIALLLLVIATCVIAYFASQTWHWAYVLVVVGLVFSTAGFFLLSAEYLRIRQTLGKAYNENKKNLDIAEAKVAASQATEEPA